MSNAGTWKWGISQSSPYPCDNNTITVSLTFNVPLFASCSPAITVSGLTGTVTASGTMTLTGVQVPPGSLLPDLSASQWTRNTGTLVTGLTAKSNPVMYNVASGETYLVFGMPLVNPAGSQASPPVSITASFSGLSFGQTLSTVSFSSSYLTGTNAFSGTPSPAIAATQYTDSYLVSLLNAGSSPSSPVSYPAPQNYNLFPLYVMPARLYTMVLQSSPFPCASNRITIGLQSSVPLLPACTPTVTISGLAGTSTLSNSATSVVFVSGGSGAGGFNGNLAGASANGVWTQNAGTLQISLTSALTAVSASSTSGNVVDKLLFVITLTNPTSGDPSRNVCVVSPCTTPYTGVFSTLKFTSTSDSTSQSSDPNRAMVGYGYPGIFSINSNSANLAPAVTFDSTQASISPQTGDALPLNLRSSIVTYAVTQLSANPCSVNTLTVTFTSSVPLYTSCFTVSGFVNTSVVLSGIVGTTTPTQALAVTSTIFAPTGAWTSAGSLTLTPSGTVVAGSTYTFSFTVTNQQASQASVVPQLQAPPFALSDSFTSVAGATAPMTIYPLTWTSASASQSIPWPCSPNTITIQLQPSVPLLITCKATSAEVPGGRPAITLLGLTGSVTPSNASLPLAAGSSAVSNNGTWTQSTGRLVFWLTSDVSAASTISFTFSLTNQAKGQNAPIVLVSNDRLTQANGSTQVMTYQGSDTTTTWMTNNPALASYFEGSALFVRVPSFQTSSSVTQTTAFPCAQQNQITVNALINIPLFSSCSPSLVMNGLTGSASTSISVVFSSSTFSNSSAIVWNYMSGVLQFNTSAVVASGDGTQTQLPFTFSVANGASGQNTPTISIRILFNGVLAASWQQSTLAIAANNPLYIISPSITAIRSSQSSPYPCDINTITIEMTSPVPFFAICTPKISIEGMIGTVNDTSLNADGQLTLLRSTSALATPAQWDRNLGNLFLNISADIPSVASPSAIITIQFEVRNQASQQAAPAVSAFVQYSTKGGTAPTSPQMVQWSVPSMATFAVAQAQYSRSAGVVSWVGDSAVVSDWRKVLYIRSPSLVTAAIGQSSPIPAAMNTISLTMSFNVEPIPKCRPRVVINNLLGACDTNAPDLPLASPNSLSDYLKFTSVAKVAGHGTFNSSNFSLALYASTDPSYLVSAGTNYYIMFNIYNPIQGQEAPSISGQVVYDGAVLPPPVTFSEDTIDIPASVNSISFVSGDAMALSTYAPVFLQRLITQTDPLPGQLNTFEVSLMANMQMPENTAITLSGFLVNTPADPNPASRIDLSPSGSIALSDLPGSTSSSVLSLVKDSAGPSGVGNFGKGYFDRTAGRLTLYVGTGGLSPGVSYGFSFQLRNPQCQMDQALPCIRASRINAGCTVASIGRNLMDTMANSTAGLVVSSIDNTVISGPQVGEALPLRIRAPIILLAAIEQSSAFPCDTNTLTFMFSTSVPLVAELNQALVFWGLQGINNATGLPVQMPGSYSVQLPITTTSSIFSSAAIWNPLNGTLTVPVISASTAGTKYTFSVTLQNPSSPQLCASAVFLNITGMCFPTMQAQWPLPGDNANIPSQGQCTPLPPTIGSTDPTSRWGSSASLAGGKCPLTVTAGVLQLNMIQQSSSYPCDPSNIITVYLVSNVPLAKCQPSITLYGLNGTLTQSSKSFPVSVQVTSAGTASTINADWNASGRLNISSLSLVSKLPAIACQAAIFSFTLRNSKIARPSAVVQIEISGFPSSGIAGRQFMLKYSDVIGTTYSKDPLLVVNPLYTYQIMSQSNPWPGSVNTLTVTFATNVPLWSDCGNVVISNLAQACASMGPMQLHGSDAGAFSWGSQTSLGNWVSLSDATGVQQGSLSLMISGIVASGTAPCGSVTCNPPVRNYTFSFTVWNPTIPQYSPNIQIYSDGTLGGVPIIPTSMSKDLVYVPVLQGVCTGAPSGLCLLSPGDAAPLRVQAPNFLMANIGQSTPYPGKMNAISVTLLANIPLQAGSSITLSNLAGAITPSAAIAVQSGVGFGSTPSSYFTSSNGAPVGKGTWDLQASSLTLLVANTVPAGTLVLLSFQLQNPYCAQESPPVCIRASDISPTNCTSCSVGKCVALPRMIMQRDFVTLYGTGVLDSPYPFAKYSPAATITFGNSNQGDAYPLKVYAPSFVVKRIGQSTAYPSKINQITVTMATSVPLISNSTITIFGLTGSTTSSGSLILTDPGSSGFLSCFRSSGNWNQGNGTLVLTVISDTIAGTQYKFSFLLQNPPCPQSPPSVSVLVSPLCFATQPMCEDMITPSNSAAGFYQAIAGDAQALLVKAPSFLSAAVWQKNPYPGYSNTINIEFATNVNMPAATKLTISGLTGSTTSNGQLTLSFPPSDSESSASSVYSTAAISSTALWNRSTGSLVAVVQAETLANVTIRFSFTIQNPLCCQAARVVNISTSMPCFQNTIASWKSQTSVDPSVVVNGETGETAPLLVRCPLWKVALISSSSNYPCTNSVQNLTIQLNVPVGASSGVSVTLSGMGGDSLTPNGSIALSSTVVSQGQWFSSGGILTGLWNLQQTAAYQYVTILFTLINPSNSSSYLTRNVSVAANICNNRSGSGLSNVLIAPVVQIQPVLNTTAASFILSNIGQKTSWPAATNSISITLQANMPLYGTGFNCGITITIKGFDNGLCNFGPDGTLVPLFGSGAATFWQSAANWSASQKSLTLSVAGTLDTPRSFSFLVTNWIEAQPSPLFQLGASGVRFLSSLTSLVGNSNAPTGSSGIYGSSNGVLYNPAANDALPLRIQAPAFITANVGQSSFWPGVINTIGITFAANVDMQAGAVVIISSLNSLDGSPSATSGSLILSGADSAKFTSSLNTAPLVTGQGWWDDSSKTLTLYNVVNLTAGSSYTVLFQIRNPLCGQPASPVCIRARGLSVGCASGFIIPRKVMNAAQGLQAPLMILAPNITAATLVHSTPFASAMNQLSLTVTTNVPVTQGPTFAITLSGLSGSVTPGSITGFNVSMTGGGVVTTLPASWFNQSSTLVFLPASIVNSTAYTFNFTLQNSQCNQPPPTVSIQISGLCFNSRVVNPLPYVTCNMQATNPLQILGGSCGQSGSPAMFTQKLIGQSTSYPGCDNVITLSFTVNVPLPANVGSVIVVDFDNSLAMNVVGINDNLILGGLSAGKFVGSTSVVSLVVNNPGWNCTCPGGTNNLVISAVAGDSGSGAAGTYTLVNGIVTSWNLSSGGTGYMVPPTVTLNGTVCTVLPNITAQMSYGAVPSGKGRWDAVNRILSLGVSTDVLACTSYTVSFTVHNPVVLPQGLLSSSILQDAKPVMIYSLGVVILPVQMNYSDSWLVKTLPGVSTLQGDHLPMRVQAPKFLVKAISQSNPFPGAQLNTLTVTFAVNTLLRAGSQIAISSISGAMGTVLNRADLTLLRPDNLSLQISSNNFKSNAGTLNAGTWYDCEKTLVFVASRDLTCNGTNFTFSFQVSNPVAAQPCAQVLINVSGISNPAGFSFGLSGQITANNLLQPTLFPTSQGVPMDPDTTTILSNVAGAAKGDACAMKIWPAAFVLKSVGQSSPYPCAVNTLSVTISSNVPLPASVQYVNVPGTIYTYIVISRLVGVQLGNVGVSSNPPKKGDVGPNVLASTNNTKTINLVSSDVFNATNSTWINDPTLFQSGVGITSSSQAMWNAPNSAGESSVQLYIGGAGNPNNSTHLYFRNGMANQNGCFDSYLKFRFSFLVYNPSLPQTPSYPVSIAAFGIPIPASAMIQATGIYAPMFVKQGNIMSYIQQAFSSPCRPNTISVTISTDIQIWPRCSGNITISGLALGQLPSSLYIYESTSFLNSSVVDTSASGKLVLGLDQALWPPAQPLIFSFQIINPNTSVSVNSVPTVQISGFGLVTTNMSLNSTDTTKWPGFVQQPAFNRAEIWQSSPFPSQANTLTVTLQMNVDMMASCNIAFTITNLAGACSSLSTLPLQSASGSVAGKDRFASTPNSIVAIGSSGSAAWNQQTGSLTLYLSNNLTINTTYAFRFVLQNPSSPQLSPSVSIQASGIVVPSVSMNRITGVLTGTGLFGATDVESQPLQIRGLSGPWTINGTISQFTSAPAANNSVLIIFMTSVPLTVNPLTSVIVSGLSGALAADGASVIYDQNGLVSNTFSGSWNNTSKQLFLSIMGGDSLPGVNYTVQFSFSNPQFAQSSPPITIETTGGVIIQQSTLLSPSDATAPLFVVSPQLSNLAISRLYSQSAYPGAQGYLVLKFTCTVALVPMAGSRLSVILSGLVGMVQPAGVITVVSNPPNLFTACDKLNISNSCLLNTAIWNNIAQSVTLNIFTTIPAGIIVTVTFPCTYGAVPQGSPSIFLEVTRNFIGFTIPPASVPSDTTLQADQQALLIFGSATFLTKNISQSSSVSAGTNTITVQLQPAITISGSNAALTISGLNGSPTSSGVLTVYDQGSVIFSSVAAWNSATGTLVLKIANGQSILNNVTTTFKFDLTNPINAQGSSDQILISCSGAVPFHPSPMAAPLGGILPIKVDAMNFSQASISQSSAVPNSMNLITVTFQAPALLSRVRQSTVTIEGLVGSETGDSGCLPLLMINPVLATNQPPLFSPFDDLNVSSSDSCSWVNQQVLLSGAAGGIDLTGSTLYFTAGACVGRWTRIVVFNSTSQCANLSTNSQNLWDDGSSACLSMGQLQSFQVLHGGSGYRNGDGTDNSTAFTIVSATSGSGLFGRCVVNQQGAVTGINVVQPGSLYTTNLSIVCPSNCISNSSCNYVGSGSGAVLVPVLQSVKASVSAGSWLRASGSLVLRVRDQVCRKSQNLKLKGIYFLEF